MVAVAEFEHNLQAFFRSQSRIGTRVGLVGVLEAVKNPARFLHARIIYTAGQSLLDGVSGWNKTRGRMPHGKNINRHSFLKRAGLAAGLGITGRPAL